MLIKANDRILFTGDSITDSGRVRDNPKHLGCGYVSFTASRLQAAIASPELEVFNRGISGNRTIDLLNRVGPDLLDLKPTVISILIGVNDVWRRFDDKKDPTSIEVFEKNYRTLLEKIKENLSARVVLLEPFVLHVRGNRYHWREDLNQKIDMVRKLAIEFGAEFIALDGPFAQAATRAPADYWAGDGIHPTPAGHALIAEAWLKNAGY